MGTDAGVHPPVRGVKGFGVKMNLVIIALGGALWQPLQEFCVLEQYERELYNLAR